MEKPEIQKLPLFIVDLHDLCNQNCVYCSSGSGPKGDFGPIAIPESRGKIANFFKSHGPFNVLFTGGEPLITPGILDFFQTLASHGHKVTVQSNLKQGAGHYADTISPEDTGWVLASLHSVALDRFDSFLEKASMLKEKGYRVAVKVMLDRHRFSEIIRAYDTLAENGHNVFFSPVINYPENQTAYPESYTDDEWLEIAPRMNMLSAWLFFAGGWRSRGSDCRAGSGMFITSIRPGTDAAVVGCNTGYPEKLGSLISGEFQPVDEEIICGSEYCLCDLFYYAGIIPGLDDSEAFYALLEGKSKHVSYASFKNWIEANGAETMVELPPSLSRSGAAAE